MSVILLSVTRAQNTTDGLTDCSASREDPLPDLPVVYRGVLWKSHTVRALRIVVHGVGPAAYV